MCLRLAARYEFPGRFSRAMAILVDGLCGGFARAALVIIQSCQFACVSGPGE
jgi:hypothetical protein